MDQAKTYRLRLWARTTDDFAGTLAVWLKGGQEPTLALNMPNTEGLWRELVLEDIRPAADQLHIYLNLMHGAGTVWVDDVELVAVE